MNTYFDSHFNKKIVTIYPGEYYASTGPEMISTVLGSCVSIALFDEEHKIGGINHFMLAKNNSVEQEQGDVLMGKFGEFAIDLLIKDLKAKNADISKLQAKVFGGSNVFNQELNGGQVGEVNTKFAFDYLTYLNIPILNSNTGGTLPRKIFFDPCTAKVYMKYINNMNFDSDSLQKKEASYIETIKIAEVKNLFPNG